MVQIKQEFIDNMVALMGEPTAIHPFLLCHYGEREEVDNAVDGMTAIIEPLLMFVIGGIVAFVLIAMYLPIFGLADNLQGGKQ